MKYEHRKYELHTYTFLNNDVFFIKRRPNISRTIQTRSELYRLSLGSIITLTFSVLCNLDLLPADQLSVFHQFFSEKISSFLKGRMISKEINQGLYKAGPEFSFETVMTFKEG